MPKTADLERYLAAGIAHADAERLSSEPPDLSGELERDWPPLERWLGARAEALRRLRPKPARSAAEQAAAAALLGEIGGQDRPSAATG